MKNARAAAAKCLQRILQHEQSASTVLPSVLSTVRPADKALVQAIVFGVLRQLPSLEWLAAQLLDKPIKQKQRVIHYVVLVGLYQLSYMRTKPHGVVAECVNAATVLKQPALKGMVNGVLRTFQRQQAVLMTQLAQQPTLTDNHPAWLRKRLQQAYGDRAVDIMQANNTHPPMWLRVDTSKITALEYCAKLAELNIAATPDQAISSAVKLDQPVDVSALPGFNEGIVSVQDRSAQIAAMLLAPQADERVLDACAAPGGKSIHVLEYADHHHAPIELVALEVDPDRANQITENLERVNRHAKVIVGDARYPEQWAGSELFDRILLDAPCSAAGIIRRHPDIKWLRRDDDIASLAVLQGEILAAQWRCLKPGGTLIYATCSVLPEENAIQIERFLAEHKDAELVDLAGEPCLQSTVNAAKVGWQLLPGVPDADGDGFYYAKLVKQH